MRACARGGCAHSNAHARQRACQADGSREHVCGLAHAGALTATRMPGRGQSRVCVCVVVVVVGTAAAGALTADDVLEADAVLEESLVADGPEAFLAVDGGAREELARPVKGGRGAHPIS
eukprot:3723399-Prymnesium_polylepis.1